MARVVIDIPDMTYESIMKYQSIKEVGADFIRQGTVLPEGHGDLKDANLLINELRKHATFYADETKEDRFNVGYTECACEFLDLIDNAPTVIAADKENRND